jgi:hypothetical protein
VGVGPWFEGRVRVRERLGVEQSRAEQSRAEHVRIGRTELHFGCWRRSRSVTEEEDV